MSRAMIKLYLLLEALTQGGKAFHAGIYVVFLLSRGLDIFEASLVNTWFAMTLVLAEFPTGVIADVWGRRISFIVSCFVTAAGLVIYAYAPSFWWFVCAESVIAVGFTCATGSFQAWIVDTLHHHGAERVVNKVFVRAHQVKKAVTIVSALAGAYTAQYFGYFATWIVGAVAFVIAGLITVFFMREDYFTRAEGDIRHHLGLMKGVTVASIRIAATTPALKFILFIAFAAAFAAQPWNMQWQPFFLPYFGNAAVLGWIFMGVSVFSFLGITLSHRVLKRGAAHHHRFIILNQFGIGIAMAAASLVGWIPGALFLFLIHEIGRGAFGVLNDAYMNERIPSSERASLLSLNATMSHVGMVLGLVASGYIGKYFSIRSAWFLSALFTILAGFYAKRMIRNGKDS